MNGGTKAWYESRTIWLNLAAFGVMLLNNYAGFVDFKADPWVAEMFTGVVAFVNVYLRTQTAKAIGSA